ncbi:oxygen regulatory protein NreC [mine drainage metagenome]|uniref:Oxygen regulatory protein NreC n=1 Tax=mine drainage metagenome TaxID=410659 RepID=A0A1J5SIL6_9ZZZZ
MPANSNKIYQVAVTDDHTLMRNALARLIASFDDYAVIYEAGNGRELIEKIQTVQIPDIILLDINMPEMDGFETAKWLTRNYPQIKVLALSMQSDESSIIRMLRLGAKGYLMKNVEPDELNIALESVIKKDFYLSETISGKVISGLHQDYQQPLEPTMLSDKDKEFLRLICTELTYKDIAEKLFVSPRTVDDYRNALFEKLNVHTRMGLAMYAIKNKIVEIL